MLKQIYCDLPKLQHNDSLSPRISHITEKVTYEGKEVAKNGSLVIYSCEHLNSRENHDKRKIVKIVNQFRKCENGKWSEEEPECQVGYFIYDKSFLILYTILVVIAVFVIALLIFGIIFVRMKRRNVLNDCNGHEYYHDVETENEGEHYAIHFGNMYEVIDDENHNDYDQVEIKLYEDAENVENCNDKDITGKHESIEDTAFNKKVEYFEILE